MKGQKKNFVQIDVAEIRFDLLAIRAVLPSLSPDQRKELIDLFRQGYCINCGNVEPCNCGRDE